jgi:hypothetical protein
MTLKNDKLANGELSEEQLAKAAGGNRISLVPNPRQPKFGPAGSIAQGEINSNSTDDNLPDSGGGIIV